MGDDLESLEAIAERLELTRLALNFVSQAELASAARMSRQRWNKFVTARDRISVDAALQLCRQYGLSLDWIYRGDLNTLPSQFAKQIEAVKAAQKGARPRNDRTIELHSATDVIDVLGGTRATARFTGRRDQAVSNWRANGRLPADTYLVITQELGRLGYYARASLWGMHDPELY